MFLYLLAKHPSPPCCEGRSMNKMYLLTYLRCTFQHSTFTCSFRAGVGLRFVPQVLEGVRQSSQHAVALHRFLGGNKKYYSCRCLKRTNMSDYFLDA